MGDRPAADQAGRADAAEQPGSGGSARAAGISRKPQVARRVHNHRAFWRNDMVTLRDALRVIAAAEKQAQADGQPANVAVVDGGGNLVAFARMDGAWLGSIDIAINKAYTARAFNISTKELAAQSQPGKPLFGIAETNQGRIVIFAGGIPLQADGQVVGAV